MIDKLVIQIPFLLRCLDYRLLDNFEISKENPWNMEGVFSVKNEFIIFKKSAREVFLKSDGTMQAEDIFCPWDSLKTSHSGLAIKPFLSGNGKQCYPYLEIKCSPAKLAQGHNVYGTDKVYPCVQNMLTILCQYYPSISSVLDFDYARLSEIDITYSAKVENKQHRHAIIQLLANTSQGQTRNRGDCFQTTAYFGSKNSRHKKIKVYLKAEELEHDIKQRKKKLLSLPAQTVIKSAENLVRFELTLKKDWLEKRLIKTNLKEFIKRLDEKPETIKLLYIEGMKDLFKSLRGEQMTITSDGDIIKQIDKTQGHIRGKTARLMGFYQSLKAVGYNVLKNELADKTFRRNIKDLEECGFSRSFLCSLHEHKGCQILNFPQIININSLGDFLPDNYEYPILKIA